MGGSGSTLRPHGGYRRLRSFQVTEIIYDGTVAFCDRFVDKRSRTRRPTPATYAAWLRHTDPSVVANTLICLIHQANYLLDHQIRSLERLFIEQGGYSEQLHGARLEARRKQAAAKPTDRTDPSDLSDRSEKRPAAPPCPACGNPMVVRTARRGRNAGSQFWGCSEYPRCTATLPV
jgi:restriction system protein